MVHAFLSFPLGRASARTAFLLLALAASGAEAGSQTYAAREGNAFAGDQLNSDTGEPFEPGLVGDLFEQVRLYSPQLVSVYEEQTVTWDDGTEQLVGFTENGTSTPFNALVSETIVWTYSGTAWTAAAPVVVMTTGSTSLIERTPLLAPFVPPSGGGSGGSTPLSDLEIQELQMAGVDAAFRAYLDPNYNLDGITREQLAADLARLEAILAGYYTPEVPEPATVGLMAAGGLITGWAARRRARRTDSGRG